MDRRALLRLGATASGSLLALPTETFAATPPEAVLAADLEATLDLEGRLLDATMGSSDLSAAGWSRDKLLKQSATTLLWAGKARKAAASELEAAALDAELDDRIDSMVRTLWAVALELEALEDDEAEQLEALLVEEPWIVEQARLEFTAQALENDASLQQVDQIDKMFERALWKIQHQGFKAIKQQMVSQLDKLAKRDGVDWRAEARKGAKLPFVRRRPSHARRNRGRKKEPETVTEFEELSRKQRKTGSWMLGIGLVWLLGFPYLTIFGGICFGPPLIVIGAIKLAAAKRNREQGERLRAQLRDIDEQEELRGLPEGANSTEESP